MNEWSKKSIVCTIPTYALLGSGTWLRKMHRCKPVWSWSLDEEHQKGIARARISNMESAIMIVDVLQMLVWKERSIHTGQSTLSLLNCVMSYKLQVSIVPVM
mmetsp:Transcript_34584/g.77534  ORF Transcript_34584/g.77534 Transcript_34584/m.77534 type:complete len:102 (-) Transcript_34584:39-344(-)